MNQFFNLVRELSKSLNNNEAIQQLDFTKKEDVEKLDNAIETLRNNEFFSNFFGEDLFEELQDKAHNIYAEAHKKDEEDKTPVRPQLQVSDKIKKQITNLAIEYMNTMILPYANLNQNQVQDILNGLLDFGCWIYKK